MRALTGCLISRPGGELHDGAAAPIEERLGVVGGEGGTCGDMKNGRTLPPTLSYPSGNCSVGPIGHVLEEHAAGTLELVGGGG